MASQPGFLYKFPWEDWGNGKYMLFVPTLAAALLYDDADRWHYHMIVIAALRYLNAQFWQTLSRCHAISDKTRVQTKLLEFKQVDREENWDDYIILQVIVMTIVHWVLPGYSGFPSFNAKGLWHTLLFHAGPTEFVYYWFHRGLHHHSLYAQYHSHHHASFLTEPISGSCHPFLEHIGYTANFAIPLLGTWYTGTSSWTSVYAYLLGFDFLNALGHCNFEVIPHWLYEAVPPLKYLLYTSSFHSLHHSRVHINFCLFMPIYDYLYGTADIRSDDLHKSAWTGGRMQDDEVADVAFLAHGTELLSVFHLPFMGRSLSSKPFNPTWWLYPLYPLAVAIFLVLRVFGKPFVAMKHRLGQFKLHVHVIPAWGVQFFMKSEHERINAHIENSILKADKAGVKVVGLGALNKAEFLNRGGAIFVEKHQKLRTRVVHGNTLTTAVLLKTMDSDIKEIFLTGATSKIGKAMALYLCAKGVKVNLLTESEERFKALVESAPSEFRHNLIRAARVEDGSHCKQWVIGKPISDRDQALAPKGTFFHQFVVPPVKPLRNDCSYGVLPALKLPDKTQGVHAAMMDMDRRYVYACYAGAIVHALEGWDHHEVGTIDPSRIDQTWEAAMRHGFKLPEAANSTKLKSF